MPKWILFALMASTLHAAAIRGTVVEKQTGKPLARALVVVQPVTGSKGATASGRTNPYGVFEISGLPAGMYVATASKTGFAKVEYGQKRWFSAGTPFLLAESQDLSLRFALPHFGAVTGRAVDENNVGIPNCPVLAYRNTRPPELVDKSVTDDRGVYRISSLAPGTYLVRTGTMENDTGVYLPTFSHSSQTVGGAGTSDVVLDQDSLGADVRPVTGRLFSANGRVWNPNSQRAAAVVTLVSDMGSQRATTGEDGRFEFSRIAPGAYELYAQAGDSRSRTPLMAYLPIDIERDRPGIQLDLAPLPSVQFSFLDLAGKRVDATGLPLLARRKELSGTGRTEYLRLDADGQARLDPGRWEVALGPVDGWYTARFTGPGSHAGYPAGWNEMVVSPGPMTVEFRLSPSPAALRGVVNSGDQPVAGAPVYLEAYSPTSGRRVQDLRTTRTDTQGRYSFVGLAPGSYRILATFDYQAPESVQMTAGHAPEVSVEEGRAATQDLSLWVLQ
jgi:large repetitive protein